MKSYMPAIAPPSRSPHTRLVWLGKVGFGFFLAKGLFWLISLGILFWRT